VRIGNDYLPEQKPVSVEIALAGGDRLKGHLWLPAGRLLADALNAPHAFVEFQRYGEEHASYIAKSQIAVVRALEVPKSSPLIDRRGSRDADDPYEILAVAPGAPWHVVREAYLSLAKVYHPDRFAGVGLPVEVADYLGSKVRRINAAYAMLEDSFKHAVARTGEVSGAPG
jgi:hypothetical protein